MRLTARRLNRATLARQLLLRREPVKVAEAVRRVVALQAQEAASPYLALWNRLAPFDPAALDAAFARHEVIKATLMRITLHTVTAADYPAFHCAMAESLRAARLYDRRYTQTGLSDADADALIPHLVEFTAERRTNAECEALLNARLGADQPRAWWARRSLTTRRTAGRPACSSWPGVTWKGSARPRRPISLSSPCSPGPRPGTHWTPWPGSSSGGRGRTAACCSTCPARRFPARTPRARRG
jgi:hypothetical protein